MHKSLYPCLDPLSRYCLLFFILSALLLFRRSTPFFSLYHPFHPYTVLFSSLLSTSPFSPLNSLFSLFHSAFSIFISCTLLLPDNLCRLCCGAQLCASVYWSPFPFSPAVVLMLTHTRSFPLSFHSFCAICAHLSVRVACSILDFNVDGNHAECQNISRQAGMYRRSNTAHASVRAYADGFSILKFAQSRMRIACRCAVAALV